MIEDTTAPSFVARFEIIAANNYYQSTRNDVIFNIIFENHISASALKLQAANSGYSFEGSHHFPSAFYLTGIWSDCRNGTNHQQ